MKLLTLVVPCFNEIDSLPILIEKLEDVDDSVNFLILDNGSNDGSKEFLNKISSNLKPNINIFYIDENNGYGAGILKGLETITDSKYIGWIHGDLQFDFLGLRQALEYLNYSNKMSDLIFYKGVRKGRKIFDSFFSYFMGISASIVLGMNFKEINAQPTIFSNQLMFLIDEPPNDFSFDTYIYWLALKNGYKIKRDFYIFPPRQYGNSKWNLGLGSKLKFSKNLFLYFLKLRKSNKIS